MRRFLVVLLAALLLTGAASAQHSFSTREVQISGTSGLQLFNDIYQEWGTSAPIRMRYSSGSSRYQVEDSGGNVMGYWTDFGTTGGLTTTGVSSFGTLVLTGAIGYAQATGATSLRMEHVYAGDCTIDFNAAPSNGTSGAAVRFLRSTNTSGARTVTIYKGDNSLTVQWQHNAATGDTTNTGDLAVNGGDITSTATTMNVFNTTSTTVNAFGKATALTVGESASGSTTVRNRLVTSAIVTFTANDTTPSVANANTFKIPGTWTAGNNITALDDHVAGQLLRIVGGDSDCTIVDGSNLKLAGNWVANADDTLSLISDGTNLYELGRADN